MKYELLGLSALILAYLSGMFVQKYTSPLNDWMIILATVFVIIASIIIGIMARKAQKSGGKND